MPQWLRHVWRVMRWVLVVPAGLAAVAIAWGCGIEPRLLDVTHPEAVIPHLRASWRMSRVAFFGDLQVGMWLANTDTVRRAVEHLLADRPDIVVLLGDFAYEPKTDQQVATQLAELRRLLGPLQTIGVPVFAVLGNHDYAQAEPKDEPRPDVAREVASTLSALGIRVLRNEAVAVQSPAGESLFLVGVGPHWPRRDEPDEAFSSVPESAARIVVMHNPDTFRAIDARRAPLAVAGHTHGGQVRLPFLPHWSWMELVRNSVHADGWIVASYGKPGNRLYVNRGIGFSTVPIRINCSPELTYFTLEAP